MALTFILLAAACSTPATSPTSTVLSATQDNQANGAANSASSDTSAITIDSYKLLKSDSSGSAAGDEVKSFKPSDRAQYFDVQLNNFLKQGSKVKWVFTAVDTTAGKDVKITEVEIQVLLGNHLTSHLNLDKDFPVGTYKADITLDGRPLGTINYTVAE